MLYLIGLGLNKEGFSYEAYNTVKKCRKLYLESYTVEMPFSVDELQEQIGKKVREVDREFVESMTFLKEAKEMNIGLLIYGNPLMATTHTTIIREAKKLGIPVKIIHGASILDAVLETGLQAYKFGKITSMPSWHTDKNKTYEPSSFMNIVKENRGIEAHTLILVDIGLKYKNALNQLKIASEKEKIKLDKIVVCEKLGLSNSSILYGTLDKLSKKDAKAPFCFIIPCKDLHFMEEEMLSEFRV